MYHPDTNKSVELSGVAVSFYYYSKPDNKEYELSAVPISKFLGTFSGNGETSAGPFLLSFFENEKKVEDKARLEAIENAINKQLEKSQLMLSQKQVWQEETQSTLWYITPSVSGEFATWSNLFVLIAAFSGAAIPVVNMFYGDSSFGDDDAEIMLKAGAGLMGVAWLILQAIRYQSYKFSDGSKKEFDESVRSTNAQLTIAGIGLYSLALGSAILGAAGVAASCAWILNSDGWSGFALQSSAESNGTVTALYTILGVVSAAYGIARVKETVNMSKGR